MTRRTLLLCALASAVGTLAQGQASGPAIRVAVGFGVDTLRAPASEIFSLWRSYLAGRPQCGAADPRWSSSERERWPAVDLLCPFVYQGFTRYTVVQLAPAIGLDSTFVLRTLVASLSDSTRDVQPLALYRTYAVREGGRWVLGNALPRLTRRWNHETIRRMTFVYPPGRAFDRRRAQATAVFVDSLARAFEIEPPAHMEYYFTDDLSETLGAAGLEFFPLGQDTVGGRSNAPNRLVFIGSSRNGEDYRHEVAHVVLWPFLATLRAHGLLVEGLMTWTGGSAGLSFMELMPALQGYLEENPTATLEAILNAPPPRQGSLDVGYDSFAVLSGMVYEAAGLPGLRKLFSAGREPRAILDTAAQLVKVEPSGLDEAWRARVRVLARGPSTRH